MVAVDVDPRHGGDESLLDLALPSTLTSLTGGGGQHLLYKHPGHEIRNGANLMPGIDFRGDGGYIVAPPSMHSSGRRYEWDLGEPDEPIALPAKVLDLHARARGAGVGRDAADRRFDEERILIEPIPEGLRNETLVRIAGHYAADGRPFTDLLRTVLGCNYDLCQPPLTRDEVVKLVESIYQAEQRKRELTDAVEHQLNGGAGTDIPTQDITIMARQAWAELDIEHVADWYVIRGESIEYVLVTDDDEARLGDDLLNQNNLRRLILNQIQMMLKPVESKSAWPKRALLLRRLAREVYAEPVKASERLDEWLDAYAKNEGPAMEPAIDDRLQFLGYRPVVADGRLHIKPESLVRFLENSMAERVRITDLRKLLRRAGWEPFSLNIGTSTTRTWVNTPDALYAREK